MTSPYIYIYKICQQTSFMDIWRYIISSYMPYIHFFMEKFDIIYSNIPIPTKKEIVLAWHRYLKTIFLYNIKSKWNEMMAHNSRISRKKPILNSSVQSTVLSIIFLNDDHKFHTWPFYFSSEVNINSKILIHYWQKSDEKNETNITETIMNRDPFREHRNTTKKKIRLYIESDIRLKQ